MYRNLYSRSNAGTLPRPGFSGVHYIASTPKRVLRSVHVLNYSPLRLTLTIYCSFSMNHDNYGSDTEPKFVFVTRHGDCSPPSSISRLQFPLRLKYAGCR